MESPSSATATLRFLARGRVSPSGGHFVIVGCEEGFASERVAVVDELGDGAGDG